jgi:uncharacterized protein YjbJ (UPF0337 family)
VEADYRQSENRVGELTDDELTKAEGRADKLAGLIQERYGKTREEAVREVNRFFDMYRD